MSVSCVVVPAGDPSGTLRVEVDPDVASVVVRDGMDATRFVLDEDRPEQFGWRAVDPRGDRGVPVAVSEVVAHCLADWDAEQEVVAMTRAAARRASLRGGEWHAAAQRLRAQLGAARKCTRVCTLLHRKWWERLSDGARPDPLTKSELARRAGYVTNGRPDTSRLVRQLGLEEGGGARRAHRRTVNYETGLRLCRALGCDPVELGL